MRTPPARVIVVSLALLAVPAMCGPGAAFALTPAERKAMDAVRVDGASTAGAAFVAIRFRGRIEDRLGTRGLKRAGVTVRLVPATGAATVITDRGAGRRARERRRGTDGRFDVVRDGRAVLLLVEGLRAPVRRVVVTTSRPSGAGSRAAANEELDRLMERLPEIEEAGELREERFDAEEEVDATEFALEEAEDEADKTINRIHRAERDIINAKSGARAREAREELERQKKKLEELTERRRTLRARLKLYRRWLEILRAALRGETVRQCNDGADNGDPEDTIADHPADPGCVEPTDNDEKDVQMPLACPAPGASVSPYAIINTPQTNAFGRFVLTLAARDQAVLNATVTGNSAPAAPLPGEICGAGVEVTYQYVVYTDGTPYSLPDPPPGDHAICVFIHAENPGGSGNPGGQDASLRLAAGTIRQ